MTTPGWHADPTRRHQHRYWDGSHWTDHVADAGQAGLDPVATSSNSSATTSTPSVVGPLAAFRRLPGLIQAGAVGLVVLVALVAAASGGGSNGTITIEDASADGSDESPSTTAEREVIAPAATSAPTTSAAPATTEAPATTSAPTTSPVRVTAAPATSGPTATTAAAPTTRPPAPVTTAVATTSPPVTQAATSSCHPSYEGTCIPPDVSDADCAGGSGNGPYYVQEKNIRVVGPDKFDLDGNDNDGIGCES